jgi:hypothetical protein
MTLFYNQLNTNGWVRYIDYVCVSLLLYAVPNISKNNSKIIWCCKVLKICPFKDMGWTIIKSQHTYTKIKQLNK